MNVTGFVLLPLELSDVVEMPGSLVDPRALSQSPPESGLEVAGIYAIPHGMHTSRQRVVRPAERQCDTSAAGSLSSEKSELLRVSLAGDGVSMCLISQQGGASTRFVESPRNFQAPSSQTGDPRATMQPFVQSSSGQSRRYVSRYADAEVQSADTPNSTGTVKPSRPAEVRTHARASEGAHFCEESNLAFPPSPLLFRKCIFFVHAEIIKSNTHTDLFCLHRVEKLTVPEAILKKRRRSDELRVQKEKEAAAAKEVSPKI